MKIEGANSAAATGALFGQGLALHRAGKLEEAARFYEQALSSDPDHADSLNLLGTILVQTGAAERGVAMLERAIRISPNLAESHFILGLGLEKLGRPGEALMAFDQAVALKPGYVEAHYHRGAVLASLQRYDEALAAHDRTIALKPEHALAHLDRGFTLRRLGRHDEALAGFDAAIGLDPRMWKAHYNRGLLLHLMGRRDEALASLETTCALAPEYADGHFDRALALLSLGDLKAGFKAYRWRLRLERFQGAIPELPFPEWNGEGLAGKTILVQCEQGFGDSLQFVRYVKPLATMAARVAVIIPAPLVSLFRSIPGVEFLAAYGGSACDYRIPLMCLPRLFGTTLETIPADIPYLAADPAKVGYWAARLSAFGAPPRVGLVWAGDSRKHMPDANAIDRRRSIRLEQLAPLASVGKVQFVSLQKGEPADEARQPPEGMSLIDVTAELNDFADTAALIENLDLVISVDTSVAHLAGALGKPVWLLNRHDTCWRWLLNRDDSPWYPTLRQFRQTAPGDWAGVVVRVRAALAAWAAGERR